MPRDTVHSNLTGGLCNFAPTVFLPMDGLYFESADFDNPLTRISWVTKVELAMLEAAELSGAR